MFFHSPEFILIFLPLSVFGYYLIGKLPSYNRFRIWYLALISLGFYFLLGLEFFITLAVSLVGNFLMANILQYSVDHKQDMLSKLALSLGIMFNLSLLGYFKYRNFFLEIILPASFDSSLVV